MRLCFTTTTAVAGFALLAGCSRETPQIAEEAAEPAPVSVPTIQLEGGPRWKPGEVVKGRLIGLEEGTYKLAWRDGAGTLWSREFEGPGDTSFSFTLSYPRVAYNELVLSRPGTGGTGQTVIPLPLELPLRGRKGYLRVLDPGDGDGSEIGDVPAEAVLWRPSSQPGQPVIVGCPILLDLAWRLPEPGDSSWSLGWDVYAAERNATMAVSLGDWPPLPVVDARADASGFRDFVRSKYGGDRAALGVVARLWERTFSGWEEVVPPSRLPDTHAICRSLAQWGDYLEFLERRAVSFLEAATRSLRSSSVAAAPIGFFGMEGPSRPGTPPFDLVGEAVQWRGGAFRPGMERLASEFLPPGRPLVSRSTSTPYAALRAGLSGSLVQIFTPDEREAALACGPLAHGLGRLIEVSNHPRPSSDERGIPGAQVALVYSHRSVRASFLLDAAETARKATGGWPFPELRDASWDRVWEGWCAILSDLGVPFVPVTEEQVASGELVSSRFRAAVAVRMLSVSEDAVRALREFAGSGGILIADAGTGMFDGRLVRVRGGEAQRLFGIEHAPRAKFSEVGSRRRMIADGQLRLVKPAGTASWFAPRGPLGVGPAEAGLVLAGARAEGLCRAVNRGELPCLTVNRVGGGWAVMLNLAVSAYLELRALPRGGRNLRELVKAALARGRAAPAVELAYDERAYPPPSVMIWDAGAVRLVVLTRDERRSAEPARVHLRFASQHWARPPPSVAIYDALAGTFLGWTTDVETELAPGEVRVFTLLPYRLASILAEPVGDAAPSARRGRSGPEAFELALRKEGGGRFEFHVIQVTVEAPGGAGREELSTLVEVAGGRSEFVIPFAESDPPGLWTLRLRDAATGLRAVRRFVR